MPIHTSAPATLVQFETYRIRQAQLNTLKEPTKTELRRALILERKRLVDAQIHRTLLHSLNAPNPEHEEMVWFWFNHFNVFWQKGVVGAALGDYIQQAIEPNINGLFSDLLLATLKHPAMLSYLDNAVNVAGKVNENYARELLELHTLGVQGGYTQEDVRVVAQMLTGCGLRPIEAVQMPAQWRPHVVVDGAFMFDPRKHAFDERRVLGTLIREQGFSGVQSLVKLLAGHEATARHIVGKLSIFLLGDTPAPTAVSTAVQVFKDTGGDLEKTTASLRRHAAANAGRTQWFKTPFRYVISALRLLGHGMRFEQVQPVGRWIAGLGQALYGRRTPDGYSLLGQDWLSAAQMTQRFELAREMVETMPRMVGQPLDARRMLNAVPVQALLAKTSSNTRHSLDRASDDATRLALLLSSPEFMYA